MSLAVGIYHRDRFSSGNSRRVFGYGAFHWGILFIPSFGSSNPSSSLSFSTESEEYYAYDSTDATALDPVTFRVVNPSMDWWFRSKKVTPDESTKLIGRIILTTNSDLAGDDVQAALKSVPLPVKNTHPQQNCVTWTEDALKEMQDKEWVAQFDVAEFKDWALSKADEWIKGKTTDEAVNNVQTVTYSP